MDRRVGDHVFGCWVGSGGLGGGRRAGEVVVCVVCRLATCLEGIGMGIGEGATPGLS